MRTARRVLWPKTIDSLDEYVARRGGAGLEAARKKTAEQLIKELEDSGLRGRGGAGFPTGRKWRTMVENRSTAEPTTVVVNGAEGEPGTFKDRSIIRRCPYHVIEGALIAALAVGADHIVFGLKRSFQREVARVRSAIEEVKAAGWAEGVTIEVFEGPDEYLYGEETALLEAIDGRFPFPRLAPPFRRGVERHAQRVGGSAAGSGVSSRVELAGPQDELVAPPALVDNVETLANVPRIIARGAGWFRTLGTEQSPGTITVTVTGASRRHGVDEVMMGTTLRKVIQMVGGGARRGHRIKGVLPGVANGIVPAELLDTPVTYEDMAAIGSGVGSGGFIVLDDTVDMPALAAGVSRFLGVESCGQCTPCKLGGLELSELLRKVSLSDAAEHDLELVGTRAGTVSDRARCYLAHQHQVVMQSLLQRYGKEFDAHVAGTIGPIEPYLIAELVDIEDGVAHVDEHFLEKQPDWSFDESSTGKNPADRLGQNRFGEWTFRP
ncbi:MAG TPA: NADH-ubiquinone oxidoreductase-F iron-sulfur binding region domain-containing protein [Acidimicrobiales bacterium]|nr:NADH-ubiquinone oxidoreductase-F iron-sulfur binding region domain-containing protein [Acidimicrobiales bacterium]